MPTQPAGWVRALVTYAEKRGLPKERLLATAGLTPAELEDPDARVTIAAAHALWTAAARELKDPLLGLHVGESISGAKAFGVIGYLSRATSTFGDVLDRVVKYHAVLGLAAAKVTRDATLCTFAFSLHQRSGEARHPVEAVAASVARSARLLTGKPLAPREVRLGHEAPPSTSEHERVLQCPVKFSANAHAVDWHVEVLEAPLAARDRELAKYLERTAAAQLEKVAPTKPECTSEVVARALQPLLGKAPATLAQVGKRLGIGARTLQRRLADEGLNFQVVLDRVREQLARELMDAERYSVSEIAWRLGYADTSALRRALQRWKS